MSIEKTRFNNFDNLVYIEARSPKLLIEELLKITKPAAIINTGPIQSGVGFWAMIEIQGEGSNKRNRAKATQKPKVMSDTKIENLELNNG